MRKKTLSFLIIAFLNPTDKIGDRTTKPQLVICDEPSMLDTGVQSQVLDLMLELKSVFNLAYLFISHDRWGARFFCDRIAVMNQGKIVEIGNTEAFFTNSQHPYTQKLLGAAPLLAKVA